MPYMSALYEGEGLFVLMLYNAKGKSLQRGRHPNLSQNCLISVELVLLCMFQTIFLMGNCS